jgi:hypothetical protein
MSQLVVSSILDAEISHRVLFPETDSPEDTKPYHTCGY